MLEDGITETELAGLRNGKCPDCQAQNSMLEGPHGGLSVNIMCSACKMRFNVVGPFGVQRIGKYEPKKSEG